MARYIDADKLHYKRVYIVDPKTEEVNSAVVVFAKEIDKAPFVMALNGKTAELLSFDEWWAEKYGQCEKENG